MPDGSVLIPRRHLDLPKDACPLPQSSARARTVRPLAGVLDHTSFPHLFDTIVSHAPPLSLLALRTASSALRDRADALLVYHLVFTGEARTRDLSVRFAPADPRYAHTRVLDLCADDFDENHYHGGLRCTGCGSRRRGEAWDALLRAAPAFVALDLVRVRGRFKQKWAEMVQLKRALRTRWAMYTLDPNVEVGDGWEEGEGALDTLVLGAENFAICIDVRKPLKLNLDALVRFTGQVFVYLVISDTDPDGQSTQACLNNVLEAITSIIFSWRPHATFTFIATETWSPHWLPPTGDDVLEADETIDCELEPGCVDMVARLRARLFALCPRSRFLSGNEAEKACRMENHIRFLSLADFRGHVRNDEVFRLITST